MLEIRPQVEPLLRQARNHADYVDEMLYLCSQKPKMRRILEDNLESYRIYGCFKGDGDTFEVPDITHGRVTLTAVEDKLSFYFQIDLRRDSDKQYQPMMNGLLHYTGPPLITTKYGMSKDEFTKLLTSYESWGWTSHT